MSSETVTNEIPDDVHGGDLPRGESVRTEERSMPKPAGHGFAGSFVVNDATRPASDILDDVDVGQRNIPDGSLYQLARATWYTNEHRADGQRVVLSYDYNPSWSDREDSLAVVMTSSRWRAGQETSRGYRAWYKYDISLRQVDDGDVRMDSSPAESLNLKIQPQTQGLVDSSGDYLSLPYGEGTLVSLQTTWIEDTDEVLRRARDLLDEVLGYELDDIDIDDDSRRLWKAEVHHRFAEERESDVVMTSRQTSELLAEVASDFDEDAEHDEHRWLESKIVTRDWERLGFPDLDVPILLKIYYPDNVESASYPFNQPKIEAALAGNPSRDKLSWDDYDDVMTTLREIVLTHLTWAGVSSSDLVADDIIDGPAAETYRFAFPKGRRSWLREHYRSLVPDIYREATKPNTQLIYDILSAVRRHGVVDYQTLMNETGAAYRTIREHISRLCDCGAENGEPGVLEKINSAKVMVSFASFELEDQAGEILDSINPDDTAEDRQERARRRRERRQDREESRDQDDSDDEDQRIWRTLGDVDITREQFARAVEQKYLDDDHVRIRTDPYPIFADGLS